MSDDKPGARRARVDLLLDLHRRFPAAGDNGVAAALTAFAGAATRLTRFSPDDGGHGAQMLIAYPMGLDGSAESGHVRREPLVALIASTLTFDADGAPHVEVEGRIARLRSTEALIAGLRRLDALEACGQRLAFDDEAFGWLSGNEEQALLPPTGRFAAVMRNSVAGINGDTPSRWFAPSPGLADGWLSDLAEGGDEPRESLLGSYLISRALSDLGHSKELSPRLPPAVREGLQDPDGVEGALRDRMKSEARRYWSAFREHADRGRMAEAVAMGKAFPRRAPPLTWRYDALCAGSEEAARNRRQAIEEMAPILSVRPLRQRHLPGDAPAPDDERHRWRMFWERIDRGDSRLQALAETFDLSTRCARRLIKFSRSGRLDQPGSLIIESPASRTLLEVTPAEYWPRSNDDWKNWTNLAILLGGRATAPGDDGRTRIAPDLSALVTRPFDQLRPQLIERAWRERLTLDAEALSFMQIVSQVGLYLDEVSALATALGGDSRAMTGVGLPELVRRAARWRKMKAVAARRVVEQWSRADATGGALPEALPGLRDGTTVSVGGRRVRIAEMASVEALARLGCEFDNCALDYAEECAMGMARLFVAVSEDGEQACIGLNTGEEKVVVKDCLGPQNRPVSPHFKLLGRRLAERVQQRFHSWEKRVGTLARMRVCQSMPRAASMDVVSLMRALPAEEAAGLVGRVWPIPDARPDARQVARLRHAPETRQRPAPEPQVPGIEP